MIRTFAATLPFLLALASPAVAFDVDYAQVFAENPDTITRTGKTTRRLDLPGNVHVVETTLSDGTASYFAYDDSPEGAPGCTFHILVDVSVTLRACPAMLDPGAAVILSNNLETSAMFVGANTVPPIPAEDIPARLADHLDAREKLLEQTGLTCPAQDDPELMPIVRTASAPTFRFLLDRMHALPRLPVSSPCL